MDYQKDTIWEGDIALMESSMKEMILSVIVPVYNPELSVLERCLACFENSSEGNYEVIFVSDGSADEVVEKLKLFAAQRPWIKIIEQENKGVSSARNHGIEQSEGRWITFCDADDQIAVDKALEYVHLLDISDYAYASYKKIKDSKSETVKLDAIDKPEDLIKKTLSVPNLYGTVWSKFFRRDILHTDNIRFHEDLTHAEDTIFVLEYLNHVKHIQHFQESFYTYYVYTNSSAKQNPEAVSHYLETMKYVIQMYQNTEYERYAGNFCIINLLIMMVHHIWKKGVSYQNGKRMLRDILSSDQIRYAFQVYDPSELSKSGRIMADMLKHKQYYLCYIACRMRNK